MSYNFIKSIYRLSPVDNNVTLAKVLLALPASETSEKPLFYIIKQEYDNAEVIFHYKRSNHQRANEIVTTLPLFIEGVFGREVADEWIMQDAWDQVDNYRMEKIDPKNGLKGVKIMNADQEEWDDSDSEYDEMGMEDVNDDDGEIIITNFDLVRLDTQATHIIGDDGKSTMSITQANHQEAQVGTSVEAATELTNDTSSITTNTRDNIPPKEAKEDQQLISPSDETKLKSVLKAGKAT